MVYDRASAVLPSAAATAEALAKRFPFSKGLPKAFYGVHYVGMRREAATDFARVRSAAVAAAMLRSTTRTAAAFYLCAGARAAGQRARRRVRARAAAAADSVAAAGCAVRQVQRSSPREPSRAAACPVGFLWKSLCCALPCTAAQCSVRVRRATLQRNCLVLPSTHAAAQAKSRTRSCRPSRRTSSPARRAASAVESRRVAAHAFAHASLRRWRTASVPQRDCKWELPVSASGASSRTSALGRPVQCMLPCNHAPRDVALAALRATAKTSSAATAVECDRCTLLPPPPPPPLGGSATVANQRSARTERPQEPAVQAVRDCGAPAGVGAVPAVQGVRER